MLLRSSNDTSQRPAALSIVLIAVTALACFVVSAILLHEAYERFTITSWVCALAVILTIWTIWVYFVEATDATQAESNQFARDLFDLPQERPIERSVFAVRDQITGQGLRLR